MPSYNLSTALLILGEQDSLPWTSTAWQALTEVAGIPWETPAEADPDDAAPNVHGWTVRTAQSVKCYAENLWSKSPADRFRFSTQGFSDNNAAGRTAWNAFVQSGVREWKFNKTVDNVLKDCKVTAYDAMARAKIRVVSVIWMSIGPIETS
jgi:hypothetical protein